VVADKTASSAPSCFASRQEAHWSIALGAFSNAWVCSCKCLCNWLVQTAAEAADAEKYETKGLDTDALMLVPMVLDRMPDAKESDADHARPEGFTNRPPGGCRTHPEAIRSRPDDWAPFPSRLQESTIRTTYLFGRQ
jgi:hypothetical protein